MTTLLCWHTVTIHFWQVITAASEVSVLLTSRRFIIRIKIFYKRWNASKFYVLSTYMLPLRDYLPLRRRVSASWPRKQSSKCQKHLNLPLERMKHFHHCIVKLGRKLFARLQIMGIDRASCLLKHKNCFKHEPNLSTAENLARIYVDVFNHSLVYCGQVYCIYSHVQTLVIFVILSYIVNITC